MKTPRLARVAYDSTLTFENQHFYNYWSMRQKISLSCAERFYKGDVVELLPIDPSVPTTQPVRIERSNVEVEHCLLFISNTVPVPEDWSVEFKCENCEIILKDEARAEGNKIFSMLVRAPINGKATITGYPESIVGESIVFDIRR
jgi:hypothetical protein